MLLKGVMLVMAVPTSMGCDTSVPRAATSHSGRAPLIKTPLYHFTGCQDAGLCLVEYVAGNHSIGNLKSHMMSSACYSTEEGRATAMKTPPHD